MLNSVLKVKDIRDALKNAYKNKEFTVDRTGAKTVEIIGATFIADEDHIIRPPNREYIERELDWYKSQSLYVEDIPGETPTIWKQVACNDGKINSNYGYCVYSYENGDQYKFTLDELKKNPDSRRAQMIYTRPSMHTDFNTNGMNDFMCTAYNQFFVRDNRLISHYVMRSNDSVFGYNNDYAWAKFIQQDLAKDLNVKPGEIIWTASNLHVYERHFHLLEE